MNDCSQESSGLLVPSCHKKRTWQQLSSYGGSQDIDLRVLDQDGTLDVPDDLDARRIVTYLLNRGFSGDCNERDVMVQLLTETGFAVALPKQDFAPRAADNLRQLLDCKFNVWIHATRPIMLTASPSKGVVLV